MMRSGRTEVLDRSATSRMRVLRYIELEPPAELANLVEAIGLVQPPRHPPGRKWRILPDARARATLPVTAAGRATLSPATLAPFDARTIAPEPRIVVRFTPWYSRRIAAESEQGAKWWMRAARDWERDAVPLLEREWPEPRDPGTDAAPIAGSSSRIDDASTAAMPDHVRSSTALAFHATRDWLRRNPPPGPSDNRSAHAWRVLATTGGRTGVRELARLTLTSTRSLLRAFRLECICTPVVAQQIERFRAALRLLRADLDKTWSRAAIEAGFCDQSHFNRTFMHWADMTAGRFFAEGHHHANDVFARRMRAEWEAGLVVQAVGRPTLRPDFRPHYPERHHRRSH